MTIGQVMRKDVSALRPEDAIATGWRSIRQQRLSGVPVVDAEGHVVGLLTEPDLIERWLSSCRRRWWQVWPLDCARLADHYRKAHGATVGDVMRLQTASVAPDDSLATAAISMHECGLPILPVIAGGRLVGVVAGADLVEESTLPCPSARPGSDRDLVEVMRARIDAEPWATSSYLVDVRAVNGVLTLRGMVESQSERRALGAMARAIAGCIAVDDDHLLVRTERPAACI